MLGTIHETVLKLAQSLYSWCSVYRGVNRQYSNKHTHKYTTIIMTYALKEMCKMLCEKLTNKEHNLDWWWESTELTVKRKPENRVKPTLEKCTAGRGNNSGWRKNSVQYMNLNRPVQWDRLSGIQREVGQGEGARFVGHSNRDKGHL